MKNRIVLFFQLVLHPSLSDIMHYNKNIISLLMKGCKGDNTEGAGTGNNNSGKGYLGGEWMLRELDIRDSVIWIHIIWSSPLS